MFRVRMSLLCVIHIATRTDGGYIWLYKFCGDLW